MPPNTTAGNTGENITAPVIPTEPNNQNNPLLYSGRPLTQYLPHIQIDIIEIMEREGNITHDRAVRERERLDREHEQERINSSSSQSFGSFFEPPTNQDQLQQARHEAQHEAELATRQQETDRRKGIYSDGLPHEPTDDNQRECYHCLNWINRRELKEIFGKWVCPECLPKLYIKCNDCGEYEYKDDARETHNGDDICETCYDNHYFACENCGNIFHNNDRYTHEDNYYCQRCYDNLEREECDSDRRENNTYRSYDDDTTAFISQDKGIIMKSSRIFSAEIECNYPNRETLDRMSGELPKELGIADDGSLGNNGVEFQTPKLAGKAGEKFVIQLCKDLKENKYTTDQVCGLHIHLDASQDYMPENEENVSTDRLKTLWLFYLVFEEVILSFLPKSRRFNQYCRAIKNDYHISEIFNTGNLDQIQKLWYRTQSRAVIESKKGNKYDDTRYAGMNFHSLLANGHLEIRYHSGTLNENKILEWANLHCEIMDKIWKGEIDESDIHKAINELTIEDKTELFFKLLKLGERSKHYYEKRAKKFLVKEKLPEEALSDKEVTPN